MKKLKILFVSSEVAPFAKTGGLADVSSALPKALKELGHEVRIILPKYKGINERKYVLREVIRLKDIPITVGEEVHNINVKSAFTPDQDKIQTYFIDYRPYFNREGLYIDKKTKKEYPDNDERFILFGKAVLETLKLLFWQPDVIHCNDWQTGLIPFFTRTIYKDDEFFKKTAVLFTIHNVGYQGNFPIESLEKTNTPSEFTKQGSSVEYYEKFSFMKSGINFADFVNTVSERYASEVQESEEFGFGFQGIFKENKKKFIGILNGVDYSVWSPETDKLIPVNYTYGEIAKKLDNKKALLETFGMPFKESIPVIGIVSRLADQKGFDLLESAIDDIIKMKVQLVVLGTGDKKYHTMMETLSKKHPKNIGTMLTFDEKIAHLIEAGSDMFFMPSRYEPCGLNQMFSLKYGTVPIVRSVGGLADTIQEFDPKKNTGNGFCFKEYDAKKMLETIKRAVKLFEDAKTWKKIIKNGMKQDFSWTASAKKYTKLYDRILIR
ncbi:glycogen synthase GlgA [candidate division KSB1 bacterium]